LVAQLREGLSGYLTFFLAQVLVILGADVMAIVCDSLLGDLGHEDAMFGDLHAVMGP
jgi:hypothetical protein